MPIKIKNLLNYLSFLLISPFIKSKKNSYIPGKMLIIRIDAIGDYLLFRNFLGIIKEEDKYRDYKITLCGNVIWKDIAESLDKKYVDEFVWIDRKKFYGNLFYKFSVLREIYKKGFEIVIHPTYTREILYGDEIVWASDAPVKIGSKGVLDKHSKWKRKVFSDNYYTQLVASSDRNMFEFYRNKEFFSEILGRDLNFVKLLCNVPKINVAVKLPEKYVVLFPGSRDISKRWAPYNFAAVGKKLFEEHNYKLIIPGGPGDQKISGEIVSLLSPESVIDLTGKNTLPELIKIIAGADLLISNDSVAVHIAASVKTRFVCISNGIFFGRFHPYPKEIFKEAYYIYPDTVTENLNNSAYTENIRYNSKADINVIKAEKVCKLVEGIIKINTDHN